MQDSQHFNAKVKSRKFFSSSGCSLKGISSSDHVGLDLNFLDLGPCSVQGKASYQKLYIRCHEWIHRVLYLLVLCCRLFWFFSLFRWYAFCISPNPTFRGVLRRDWKILSPYKRDLWSWMSKDSYDCLSRTYCHWPKDCSHHQPLIGHQWTPCRLPNCQDSAQLIPTGPKGGPTRGSRPTFLA